MSARSRKPIGIFDSGIGGLTVLRALHARLHNEHYLYLGDTARVPYGTKSPETVVRYSLRVADFLCERGIKLLVVACNTASAHALEALREAHPDLPIIGVIEPGVKAAAEVSRGKRVAVLATHGTIASGAYQATLARHGIHDVMGRACPLFVPLAEEGWADDEIARMVAERYLADVRTSGADTVILGCTHYPLLGDTIAHVLGSDVTLINSAETTAEAVAMELSDLRLRRHGLGGKTRYLLSDIAPRFREVGARFLGHPLGDIEFVEI